MLSLSECQVSRKRSGRINASQVIEMLEQGATDESIKEALNISEKAIAKAKSAIIAIDPKRARELLTLCNLPYTSIVDECIPSEFVLSVSERFGCASHVNIDGIRKFKDKQLYPYAEEVDYQAIWTTDNNKKNRRDIFIIATERGVNVMIENCHLGKDVAIQKVRELPKIFAFSGGNKKGRVGGYEAMLDQNPDYVHATLKRGNSMSLTFTRKGIYEGISYDDMWDQATSRGVHLRQIRAMASHQSPVGM